MKAKEIFQTYQDYIMPTYTRVPLIITKGKDGRVWDIKGKEFLDFFPGWGVSGIGHCHPKVVSSVKSQVRKLIHISNNYYHPLQARLARKLVELSFEGKVFFCNSGAEANEAAIKLARAYGKGDRYEIITMEGSFHGRTLATLAATGQEKYRRGFSPLPEGFRTATFNDIDSVKSQVSEKTAAIMLELIQGEGGINVADRDFVGQLREFCTKKGILLVVDEVQTGLGRTGRMFCFQNYGILPDAITLAKSLAGGLPMGALVVRKEFSDELAAGMHASTFGGSPLVCKAAIATVEAIRKEKLLSNVIKMGQYLRRKLDELKISYPESIREVRGLGLMIGVELSFSGGPIVEACLNKQLLINCTQGNILRLMPALNVTKRQIDTAICILKEAIEDFKKAG
jgi:acetylornithine aminotransferase/acetylornithine/N-succinyldiaminopimelate aminotransferase